MAGIALQARAWSVSWQMKASDVYCICCFLMLGGMEGCLEDEFEEGEEVFESVQGVPW